MGKAVRGRLQRIAISVCTSLWTFLNTGLPFFVLGGGAVGIDRRRPSRSITRKCGGSR